MDVGNSINRLGAICVTEYFLKFFPSHNASQIVIGSFCSRDMIVLPNPFLIFTYHLRLVLLLKRENISEHSQQSENRHLSLSNRNDTVPSNHALTADSPCVPRFFFAVLQTNEHACFVPRTRSVEQ